MGLSEYNRKRDFGKTQEPPGDEPSAAERGKAAGRTYIIQKHAATRLHYDFRLELDGVLLSWSVPKGPSLDPKVKRLAMQTEDHPLAYATFEGIIPKGEYGGGTVLLWDRGTWEPQGDAEREFAAGNFKFVLKGEKLHGKWALIKLRGRGPAARGRDGERAWLLIKERDEEARPEAKGDIVEERPESVATQRTLEEIAADRSSVWHSNRERLDPGDVPGAKAGKLPARVAAEPVTRAKAPPAGDGWLHEMAIDGERVWGRVAKREVKLLSARGAPLAAAAAKRLAPVADAIRMLPADGLLVAAVATGLRADGRTDGAALEEVLGRRGGDGEAKLAVYVDDLLFLDGQDLRGVALEKRKELLAALIGKVQDRGALRFAQHVAGDGQVVYREACRLGMAGVVSRRADAEFPGGKGARVEVACVGGPHTTKTATTSASGSTSTSTSTSTTRSTKDGAVVVEGVSVTHPERVLWDDGRTKLDLARYYEAVGERVLPYVVGRPLSLYRMPEGVKGAGFFMKHSGAWAPKELARVKIQERSKVGEYLVIKDLSSLILIAQMSAVEVHLWNSTAERLEEPDQVVFDLDPDPSVPWARVVEVARELRERLKQVELESFVKTTGGKGLHVVVPFQPAGVGWETAFELSRVVSEHLEREDPKRLTTEMSKARRHGKILIDYLRNGRGATAVAPYSPRARPGAPVATPLDWDELSPTLRPADFDLATVAARVAKQKRDPWAALLNTRQRLPTTGG